MSRHHRVVYHSALILSYPTMSTTKSVNNVKTPHNTPLAIKLQFLRFHLFTLLNKEESSKIATLTRESYLTQNFNLIEGVMERFNIHYLCQAPPFFFVGILKQRHFLPFHLIIFS